jgi:hypothetical protein
MIEPIPQDVARRLQLAAIAGNEPADSYFWLLTKQASGEAIEDFIPVRELERAAATAIKYRRLGNAYIGCAPRTMRSGRAQAVKDVWVLFAESDSEESSARLWNFRPLPSIVDRSGTPGHFHCFWPLSGPLTPAAAKIANERLVRALRADTGTNAARMLRPIGTLNHKHAPPALVECVRLELDTFTASQVVGDLIDIEPERPAPAIARVDSTRLAAGQLDVRSIPSAEFVPRLTGREVTPAGFVRCPFHKNGEERTPSLHVSATESRWYCHATGCQQGGGLPEFYALLHGRLVPDSRDTHAFIRFVYEIKEALTP